MAEVSILLTRAAAATTWIEKKGEAKRLRSTSTTPRSEPLRARDRLEYDQIMGMNSVSPSSEEGDEQEVTESD